LGYQGSGDKIRGFNFDQLIHEVKTSLLDQTMGAHRAGFFWEAHDIDSQDVYDDFNHRLDYKYWNPSVRKKITELKDSGNVTIADLNNISTIRGRSPSPDSYVDENDGYALVVKAGNISRLGDLSLESADWIEKSLFDEYVELSKMAGKDAYVIKKNDVLLASTGDGTLGKCCVYTQSKPAIPDGHVTVIRVDPRRVDPFYLADYLRLGFGAEQIERLYTGSTGLIELTADQVDGIVVDLKSGVAEQKQLSKQIRKIEKSYVKKLTEAKCLLDDSKNIL